MTFSQIDYFLLAAQYRSITKVSELLAVSQPAVSHQLTMLENSLGVRLFVRGKSGLELTEPGSIFETLFSEFKFKLNETLKIVGSTGG